MFNYIKSLNDKYKNTNPLDNPITFQYTDKFTEGILGDKGKIYLKRGRMNDGIIIKDDVSYAVPLVWSKPEFGFKSDNVTCWTTKSELHAINHYRYSRNAQPILAKKWDEIIAWEDYIYTLSKATDSDIEIPELKDGFQLRPHQKVGVEFGKAVGGNFIIADQQRTGKSYTALVYTLSEEWDRCLIIAPAKVVPIWSNMIKSICNIPIKVLSSNDELTNGFNIVSYDTLHTIDNLDCDIAIADECHFFLQVNARRSMAINRIRASKKIALSGTPLMNKAEDMLSILNWINPKLAAELEIFYVPIKNLEPYEKARIISYELKKRCLLLRETHQVGTAIEPYLNFIEIDAKVDNPKNLQEVGRAKVNYAVQYCNATEEKILVVFYYKETGRLLQARLGNKAVLIDGDTPKSEVEGAIKAFTNDKQILLGSTVLAEGLDFSFCDNILIVEESSYSLRTDQIRERCNNIYKNREVNIDILRIKESRDDRVYDILEDKFALSNGLRDG